MKNSGFAKLLIGLLFVMLHFRYRNFDLLADFVGYALIWLGLSSLSAFTVAFFKAKPFVSVLFLLSIVDQLLLSADKAELLHAGFYAWFGDVLTLVCNIGFLLFLGKAMAEMLEKAGYAKRVKRQQNSSALILASVVLSAVIALPSFITLPVYLPVKIPVMLLSLVSAAWLLLRVNRSRKDLKQSTVATFI